MNNNRWRFINPDGSTNIDLRSLRKLTISDLYHRLLSARWRAIFVLVAILYALINLIFGSAYYLCGSGALQGLRLSSPVERWVECFFFSVQTLATIGYGAISPQSFLAHVLVSIEALVGLIGFAFVTGVVFTRFARPTARVRFSKNALITQIAGVPCLVFRMANERLNQIVEAQVRVVMARFETTPEGLTFRELYDLKLERDRSPLFAMTWSVIHWIDSSSPLYGLTQDEMRNSDLELIVTVVGTDETFSQSVYARYSYATDDFVWNSDFEDMIRRTPDGKIQVDLDRIHEIRPSSSVSIH